MSLWVFNILIMVIVGIFVSNPKVFTRIGGVLFVLSIAIAIGSKSSLLIALASWLVALFIGFVIVNVKAFIKTYRYDKKSLASLSPEIQELYLQLKRDDDAFNDIEVADDPVDYLFKHAMQQTQDIYVESFKRFLAQINDSETFKADRHQLFTKIDSIFDNVSTSEEKLKQISKTRGQVGAILQNATLYAIASSYKKGEGIIRFMHGDHTNTDMHTYIAPLKDEEYCVYMLKNHKSLSAIVTGFDNKWYEMLVALGYLIMCNNDDDHHEIFSERIFSQYSNK